MEKGPRKKSAKKKPTTPKESPKAAPAPDLKIVQEPAEFFRDEVMKALTSLKVKASTNTEFYLVDLLTRFMFSENLFATDEQGAKRQEVLALLLNETVNNPDPAAKFKGLRRLGDISLYTAGFFGEFLKTKVVDVDYYIDMGKTAYGSLSGAPTDAYFRQVFQELSTSFNRFVDVLAEISQVSLFSNPQNILRAYELWLKTKSERAEKSLKEAGIVPNVLIKRDWQ
jgi:hypothetical protein